VGGEAETQEIRVEEGWNRERGEEASKLRSRKRKKSIE
jgi:hypothetical protein